MDDRLVKPLLRKRGNDRIGGRPSRVNQLLAAQAMACRGFQHPPQWLLALFDPGHPRLQSNVLHQIKLGGKSDQIFMDDVGWDVALGGYTFSRHRKKRILEQWMIYLRKERGVYLFFAPTAAHGLAVIYNQEVG